MTDLLTFIEATKGTSLKIEVTSKDLLEFADALVERAAAKKRVADPVYGGAEDGK